MQPREGTRVIKVTFAAAIFTDNKILTFLFTYLSSFMSRVKIGIVLFVCQSLLKFNLHYIWQAYSTNDTLSNYAKVNDQGYPDLDLNAKYNFFGLCCRFVLHKLILFFFHKDNLTISESSMWDSVFLLSNI